MKGSIKASILNDLSFKATVNSYRITTEPKHIFLSKMAILLYCCVPLLLNFSGRITLATPPQQIAQVNSPASIDRPTLEIGSKGERVTELQAALKLLGFYTGAVDGAYNESTAQAVSRFQQAAGLKADGIVDATTWQRLFPNDPTLTSFGSAPNTSRFPVPSQTGDTNQVVPTSNARATTPNTTATASKPEPRTPARTAASKPEPRTPARNTTANSQQTYARQSTSTRSGSTRSEQTTRIQQGDRSESTARSRQSSSVQYTAEGLPILRLGMRGSEVTKLQQRLQTLGFLNKSDIDGDFGAATEAAVIALQKRYRLEADGVVGGSTWEILARRRGG